MGNCCCSEEENDNMAERDPLLRGNRERGTMANNGQHHRSAQPQGAGRRVAVEDAREAAPVPDHVELVVCATTMSGDDEQLVLNLGQDPAVLEGLCVSSVFDAVASYFHFDTVTDFDLQLQAQQHEVLWRAREHGELTLREAGVTRWPALLHVQARDGCMPRSFEDVLRTSPEGRARKEQSEARMRELLGRDRVASIAVIFTTDLFPQAMSRPVAEVFERVAVLAIISSSPEWRQAFRDALEHTALWDRLSPLERQAMEAQQMESWRCEAVFVLLWALGLVPEGTPLHPPLRMVNLDRDLGPRCRLLLNRTAEEYAQHRERAVAEARPVAVADLLDAADLNFRLLNHFRQAYIESGSDPNFQHIADLGVCEERMRAFSWLLSRHVPWDHASVAS